MNDDKLLLNWLLSTDDIEFVIKISRGITNRLKYALQICHLQNKGRFISDWSIISIIILNHISKQLGLNVVHNQLSFEHKSTENRIKKEVKKYLGFRDFDPRKDTLISSFLAKNPLLISNKHDILKEVEKFLIDAKVCLPSKSQLMRYVYSKYGQTQEQILSIVAKDIKKVRIFNKVFTKIFSIKF